MNEFLLIVRIFPQVFQENIGLWVCLQEGAAFLGVELVVVDSVESRLLLWLPTNVDLFESLACQSCWVLASSLTMVSQLFDLSSGAGFIRKLTLEVGVEVVVTKRFELHHDGWRMDVSLVFLGDQERRALARLPLIWGKCLCPWHRLTRHLNWHSIIVFIFFQIADHNILILFYALQCRCFLSLRLIPSRAAIQSTLQELVDRIRCRLLRLSSSLWRRKSQLELLPRFIWIIKTHSFSIGEHLFAAGFIEEFLFISFMVIGHLSQYIRISITVSGQLCLIGHAVSTFVELIDQRRPFGTKRGKSPWCFAPSPSVFLVCSCFGEVNANWIEVPLHGGYPVVLRQIFCSSLKDRCVPHSRCVGTEPLQLEWRRVWGITSLTNAGKPSSCWLDCWAWRWGTQSPLCRRRFQVAFRRFLVFLKSPSTMMFHQLATLLKLWVHLWKIDEARHSTRRFAFIWYCSL